jgi:hypothetical protein
VNVKGLRATISKIDNCVMIKKEETKGAVSDGHGGQRGGHVGQKNAYFGASA